MTTTATMQRRVDLAAAVPRRSAKLDTKSRQRSCKTRISDRDDASKCDILKVCKVAHVLAAKVLQDTHERRAGSLKIAHSLASKLPLSERT